MQYSLDPAIREKLQALVNTGAAPSEWFRTLLDSIPPAWHGRTPLAHLLAREFGVDLRHAQNWLKYRSHLVDNTAWGDELADVLFRLTHGWDRRLVIDTLNADELEFVRGYAQKCRSILWSVVPRSRSAFEEAVKEAYMVCGFDAPQFVWLKSYGAASALVSICLNPAHPARELLSRARFNPSIHANEAVNSLLAEILRTLNKSFKSNFGGDLSSQLSSQWLGPSVGVALRSKVIDFPASCNRPSDTRALSDNMNHLLADIMGHRQLTGVEHLISAPLDLSTSELVWTNALNVPMAEAGILWPAYSHLCAVHECAWHLGVDYMPFLRRLHSIAWRLARHGYWSWHGRNVVVCCDGPTLLQTDNLTLHSLDGPAVAFADGFSAYAVRGVSVPRWIIEQPESITVDRIEAERSAEVRRIMTEIFGYGRYLAETGAEVIHMDMVDVNRLDPSFGSMPRALMRDKEGRKWLVGTDGSTKRVYYMRVEDDVMTCSEAHSALAGFDESDIIASS